MKVCSVDGCDKPFLARGWCAKHYRRWQKHGDPSVVLKRVHVPRLCAVEDCESVAVCRGWCNKHYRRYCVHGDPTTLVRLGFPGNLLRNLMFMPPTTLPTGCVEFTGMRDKAGYGKVRVGDYMEYAHRAMHELLHGPIPEGHDVHHRCENQPCVIHTESMTPAEHRARHGKAA